MLKTKRINGFLSAHVQQLVILDIFKFRNKPKISSESNTSSFKWPLGMHRRIYWRWLISARFEVSVYQVSCLHLQKKDRRNMTEIMLKRR